MKVRILPKQQLYFSVFLLRLMVLVKGNVLVEYPISEYAGIVTLVFNKYYSRCVIILYSTSRSYSDVGLYEKWSIMQIEKLLLATNGKFTLTSVHLDVYNHTERKFQCRNEDQPLSVILSSNGAVKKKLEEFSQIYSLSGAVWLMFLNKNDSTVNFFSNINVPFDCPFLVAKMEGNEITLTEVYRVAPGMDLLTYPYGKWSNNGSKVTSTTIHERRNTLHGLKMKGVTIHNPPFTEVTENGVQGYFGAVTEVTENCVQGYFGAVTEVTENCVQGYFGAVWKALTGILNCSATFEIETTYGALVNGNWSGMIEMLRTKKIDIALSEFTMTINRMDIVDFTFPLLYMRYEVFIKLPLHDGMVWGDFLEPFSVGLWITICFTMIILSVFLSSFHCLGRRYGIEGLDSLLRYNFHDSLLKVLGAFCQQGCEDTPRACSCRAVFLTAYLTAMIISAAYSASLISSLTKKKITLPFRDLTGLIRDGSYKFGVLKNSAEFNLFSASNNERMKTVYEKMLLPEINNLPDTEQQGIERMCSGKFAFLSTIQMMSTLPAKCQLITLPDESFPVSVSMGLTKNNPYKNLINYNLHILRDGGTLKQMRTMYWRPKLTEAKTPWDVVDLYNIAPILVVLAGGLLMAVFLLLFERQWQRFKHPSNRHSEQSSLQSPQTSETVR